MGTTKGSEAQEPFSSDITSSEFHAEWVERAKHKMTMKGNELAMSALHPNSGCEQLAVFGLLGPVVPSGPSHFPFFSIKSQKPSTDFQTSLAAFVAEILPVLW